MEGLAPHLELMFLRFELGRGVPAILWFLRDFFFFLWAVTPGVEVGSPEGMLIYSFVCPGIEARKVIKKKSNFVNLKWEFSGIFLVVIL